MNIDEFGGLVKEYLLKQFAEKKETVDIFKQEMIKNNGIKLIGIHISRENDPVCPAIYLNGYFEEFKEGRDMDDILLEIYQLCKDKAVDLPFRADDFLQFDLIKAHIIYRLINFKMNEEVLRDVPYLPFHDLAITFRWVAHMDDEGISSVLISNKDMENWGVNISTLFQLAEVNTQRLFPCRLQSMFGMLREKSFLSEQDVPFDNSCCENGLYVATNKDCINGASVILYPDVLSLCAKMAGGDIYLLPSSIHEMIFLNSRFLDDIDELRDLVSEANASVVHPTEVLSDSIYFYDCKENRMRCI